MILFLFIPNDLGILPEALRTKCVRCSPQQMEGGLRVITKLYYDYPAQYARLRSKWDPTGEYHRRFEEYLRGLQFNTINNESRKFTSVFVTLSNVVVFHSNKIISFFIAQSNGPTNIQKVSSTPSIIASASSNSQNVIPTALPSAPVCGSFFNIYTQFCVSIENNNVLFV